MTVEIMPVGADIFASGADTLCACGCGASIDPLGSRGRRRRYLGGHATRGKIRAKIDTPSERVCTRCKLVLPANFFGAREGTVRATGAKYISLRSTCKKCDVDANRERDRTPYGRAQKKARRAKRRLTIRGWIHERIASWRRKTPGCNLTTDFLVELYEKQQGCCYYSGTTMKLAPAHADPDGISLDKVHPDRGYMIGNVVFCTFRINWIKGDLTEAAFYSMIESVLGLAKRRGDSMSEASVRVLVYPPHEVRR